MLSLNIWKGDARLVKQTIPLWGSKPFFVECSVVLFISICFCLLISWQRPQIWPRAEAAAVAMLLGPFFSTKSYGKCPRIPWVCPWLMASWTGWSLSYGKWWKWPLIKDKAVKAPIKASTGWSNIWGLDDQTFTISTSSNDEKMSTVHYTLFFLFSWNWCALSKDCNWLEILHRMLRMKIQWVFFRCNTLSYCLNSVWIWWSVHRPYYVFNEEWHRAPAKFEVVHPMVQTGAVWPWHGERKRKCLEVFWPKWSTWVQSHETWAVELPLVYFVSCLLIFVKVRWLQRVMQRENRFWRFRSFGQRKSEAHPFLYPCFLEKSIRKPIFRRLPHVFAIWQKAHTHTHSDLCLTVEVYSWQNIWIFMR